MDLNKTFLSAIGSNNELRWYLQQNSNIVNFMNPTTIFAISIIPKDILKRLLKGVTIDSILKLLQQNRPDLFVTLNNPTGLGWIKEQIDNFNRKFL